MWQKMSYQFENKHILVSHCISALLLPVSLRSLKVCILTINSAHEIISCKNLNRNVIINYLKTFFNLFLNMKAFWIPIYPSFQFTFAATN